MGTSTKWLAGGAAALLGYFVFFAKKPRFLGDKAAIGDDVFVPVGTAPPVQGIPTGAGQIMVHVTTIGPDTVSGPITGYALGNAPGFAMLPVPTAPVPIARSTITGISRKGTTVT